jgi:hypothetical protein
MIAIHEKSAQHGGRENNHKSLRLDDESRLLITCLALCVVACGILTSQPFHLPLHAARLKTALWWNPFYFLLEEDRLSLQGMPLSPSRNEFRISNADFRVSNHAHPPTFPSHRNGIAARLCTKAAPRAARVQTNNSPASKMMISAMREFV